MSFFGCWILCAASTMLFHNAVRITRTQWTADGTFRYVPLRCLSWLWLRAESHRICPVTRHPIHDLFIRDDVSSVMMLCCGCVNEKSLKFEVDKQRWPVSQSRAFHHHRQAVAFNVMIYSLTTYFFATVFNQFVRLWINNKKKTPFSRYSIRQWFVPGSSANATHQLRNNKILSVTNFFGGIGPSLEQHRPNDRLTEKKNSAPQQNGFSVSLKLFVFPNDGDPKISRPPWKYLNFSIWKSFSTYFTQSL